MTEYLVVATALLLSAFCTAGWRGVSNWLAPAATLLWEWHAGLGLSLVAAGAVRAWHSGIASYVRRRNLLSLCRAAEEPVQAMFEQASLYGSAEHCALAALPACTGRLRALWQRALAQWLRGSVSEEAFAAVGKEQGIPLLVRLARALALSRHTGSPLAHHLAVLLEDSAEDRRHRQLQEAEYLPVFVVTLGMAGALLAFALLQATRGSGPLGDLALVALVTAGAVPPLIARLLP